MSNRVKFTPEKKAQFCEELRKAGGNVSRTAEICAVSKMGAYDAAKADPEFSRAWDEAVEFGIEELETEARRRAYLGVDEPVYQGGKEVGLVRKYSDTLLIFLLKGAKPDKYRDRQDVHHSGRIETVEVVQYAEKPKSGT
jgi:hypothetical protein